MKEEQIFLPKHFEMGNEQNGPKFEEIQKKIEEEKSGGWNSQVSKFLNNKRQILTIAFLTLLLTGGFFVAGAVNMENLPASVNGVKNVFYSEEETAKLSIGDVQKELIADESLTGTIVIEAGAGDGITHLARYAVAQYLESKNMELSAEQKVYAEDYLKKLEGNYLLGLGQEVTFNTEDIEQAVENSQNLEEWQIENLTQYTQNVQF